MTAGAAGWDPERLPDQTGRTVVVTGGNAGIGFHIASQLAGAGARVVLASRSDERARAAMDVIRTRIPAASLALVRLDLASLDSVRTAASELRALGRVDVLVNNAGRTDTLRQRRITEDGLELVVGTNAFGPFALTALAMPVVSPPPPQGMFSAWILISGCAFSKAVTSSSGVALGSSKWYHQRMVTGRWARGAASGAAESAAAPVSRVRRFMFLVPP